MRKIAATYIFPGNRPPLKNGILICENDGSVVDIVEKNENFKEEAGLEFYSGILCPGFVNAHCHLELSHLKGKVREKTGIGGFIGEINRLRNEDEETRIKAMNVADRKMWASGIAAVGDISNSDLSLSVKQNSKIKYHTFMEAFGFHPSRAERAFSHAVDVCQKFTSNNLSASVVPHSPYSVSEELFEKIKEESGRQQGLFSIHNQESEGESEFYVSGTGPIVKHLQENLGIDISHWKPTGESSLKSILKYIPENNNLLLVHNTFMGREDLESLKNERSLFNTFFVLCPNSNLYIENHLPPAEYFRNEKLKICLGTDSLASNHGLSVLDEMVTLQRHFSMFSIEELIKWATINGAEALQLDTELGTFEKGKKPGVNLITGINFKTMRFTEKAKVKRLL